MSILDAIMQISGRKDPVEEMKKQIMLNGAADAAVQQPQPGTDAGGQPAPPQDPNTPKAYQSPPDLSSMYLELMNRDRNSREFDQGATLIAAGLARDENRDRIMQTYAKDPSSGSDASMFQTLALIQKQQQELAIKNQMRLAVPRIAKEFGLSLEDAYMLFENGQLEEYIKSRRTPSYVTITAPDGSQRIVDQNALKPGGDKTAPAPAPAAPAVADDGTPVPTPRPDPNAPVTPPTPEQTIDAGAALPGVVVAGPKPRKIVNLPRTDGKGGTVAVYEDDQTEVATGKKYLGSEPPPRKTKSVTMADGSTREVYEDDDTFVDTGEKYTGTGVPTKIEYKPGATPGSQVAFDVNGKRVPEQDVPGTDELTIEKDANGQFQVWNKTKGELVGTPKGAKTDTSTDDMKEWAQFAATQKGRGEAPMDFDKWYDKYKRIASPNAASANIDQNGINWGDPPTDMVYARDKDGNIIIDPTTNTPKVVNLPGSKKALTEADEAAKESGREESKKQASGIVGGMVDKAITIMDDPNASWYDPATGPLAQFTTIVEGSRRAQLEEALVPIRSTVAFKALAEMRANSPTGGALGNVSDIELRLLESTLGSINPRQGAASLKANLELIKGITSGDPETSQKALAKWREQYNPNGKDMTPAEKAAADAKYEADKAAEEADKTEAPAATGAPAKGTHYKKWNKAKGTWEDAVVE
jgi:hypothetical protein